MVAPTVNLEKTGSLVAETVSKTNHRGKKVKGKETVLKVRKPASLPNLPRAYY